VPRREIDRVTLDPSSRAASRLFGYHEKHDCTKSILAVHIPRRQLVVTMNHLEGSISNRLDPMTSHDIRLLLMQCCATLVDIGQ
jgi:hypothetical protein